MPRADKGSNYNVALDADANPGDHSSSTGSEPHAQREYAATAPHNRTSPADNNDNEEVMETAPPAPEIHHGYEVHPSAARLFQKAPFIRKIPIIGQAVEAFGPLMVFSLTFSYLLCKGIADQIIGFSRQPMFTKRFGLSGKRYQRLASLYTMGWSIKAFIAAITDTFALFGYTKRWYMLASCVGGAAFGLAYGLLPAQESSGNPAAAFIFLTSLGKSNVDILSEGHYSRQIRKKAAAGPALVSSIWWAIMIGTLIASVIQGPLSDNNLMQVGVFVSAGLQLITGVFYVFNWYGELPNREERAYDAKILHKEMKQARAAAALQRLEGGETEPIVGAHGAESVAVVEVHPVKDLHPECDQPGEGERADDDMIGFSNETAAPLKQQPVPGVEAYNEEGDDSDTDSFVPPAIPTILCGQVEVNTEVVTRNWRVVAYSAVMTASVVTMVVVTILGTTWDLLYAAIVISVVCCCVAFLTLPLVIAKANVFTYFNFTLYLQIPGALDGFYLASPECLPDGPHFSYSFYNTIGAVIANIASLFGITLFTYVFSKRSYPITLCCAVFLQVIASLFDLILVKRWNMAIGIPDHAMYLFGYAIVYQVCYMLAYMPVVILMSRLCPRGSESMIYALMAGFANLGQTMSNTIASLLVELAWPFETNAAVGCNFDNVQYLIITGHLCLPLLIIPLAFLLLPSVRVCDDVDVNGHAIQAALKKEQKKAKKAHKKAMAQGVKEADTNDN